jgi:4'-phosphopantetheinyl transferase
MEAYWLEQAESDVPLANDWLSAGEAKRLESIRFPKRRTDWRLGRWTAKGAVAAYLNLAQDSHSLTGIEIRAGASGAPEAFVGNAPAPVTISISHRAGTAACAIAPRHVLLGCDLETIDTRSESFLADYFTQDEQAMVGRAPEGDRPWLVGLFWSGKESALKALGEGLRLDTRSLTVCLVDEPHLGDPQPGQAKDLPLSPLHCHNLKSWHPLYVYQTGGQIFHGWWRRTDDLLRTMVGVPSPAPPISLQVAEHFGKLFSRTA